MARYILFAETRYNPRQFSGARLLDRILGYLDFMTDRGIIGEKITATEIWKESDIDLWFRGDTNLKKVLAEMPTSERHLLIRAKLLNESELRQFAQNMAWRYGIQHRVYETELPNEE